MNIEKLKNIQIVCKNKEDVEDCLNNLEELGFEVKNNNENYKVIFYNECSNLFENDIRFLYTPDVYFYNKKFIKILKKLMKQKEDKKDIEVASDGRIMKINNSLSNKEISIIDSILKKYSGVCIKDIPSHFLDYILKYRLAYETKEARDRAMFKLEIETDLKNIAERLNNGRKIDWNDEEQNKYNIYYNYGNKRLDYNFCSTHRYQGIIYCLDKNFLDVVKKEIGEENLIKYFEQ